MTEKEDKTTKASEKRRAAGIAKREARAELKAKVKAEANKTTDALAPLRNRVQTFVQEYESCASFEHARRMDKLLHVLLRAVEIGCQEAEKDLARISEGERPCQPSVLRKRLYDLIWDTQ
jgi:hypothetical protein